MKPPHPPLRRPSSGIRGGLRHTLLTLAALLAGAGLAGCVSPRYVRPDVPTPTAFKEDSAGAYRGAPAGTWRPAQPADATLKGRWWEVFGDPELNTLEGELNVGNQNIAAAFQAFMAARAQVSEARASYFPSISAGTSYARSQTTAAGGSASAGTTGFPASATGGSNTEIQLPVDASWEPDVWGRIRDTVRESRNAAQVSAADLANERLSEQASLAEYYFELRGQDSLQALYDRTVAADRKSLALTHALYQTGMTDEQAVALAVVTLRNAEAAAVGVSNDRALYEHAIATLIGKPASSFSLAKRELAATPPAIPVGVPAELLERRPDIAAAERTMAAANAQIGVATTAYFPTLDLTATGGASSSLLSQLLTGPAGFWSLGASLSETLFDGGLRRANLAQYTAAYREDVASYRQTVLTAFQQVEDELSTLRILSKELVRQKAATAAAQRYLDTERVRYQTGIDPYLNVMTAELTLLSDQQAEVALQTNLMTATVALVQALGGGWSTAQLPAAATVTSAAALRKVSASSVSRRP